MKRPEFAALTFIPRWLINAILPAIILSLTCAGAARTQDPIGDPNEVWVTSSTGDTLYIGIETELQMYFANSQPLEGVYLDFGIYSPDEANWEWIDRPDGEGFWPDLKILTFVSGNRWEGDYQNFGMYTSPYSQTIGRVDTVAYHFQSILLPHMTTGPLEHIISLHLIPTQAGTICIDSASLPPVEPWLFIPPNESPSWNGPICFTVVQSPYPPGDINCDGIGNVADAVYLINWIFKNGPEPCR